MNWYSRNQSLLSTRADLPAAEIDACQPPAGFASEIAASGEPTARLDGKMLHSRRDPRREARRLVADCGATDAVALFYGVGLGYHIEEFLLERPDGVAVIVEPELPMLRAALETRDFCPLLSSDRVYFLAAEDPDALAMILRIHQHRMTTTVRLRSVYERNKQYYQSLDSVQQQFAARRDINNNTLRRFAGVWIRNLARNIPLLAHAAGISIASGRFVGLPALMLAAGPSLDLVLPHIRQLRRRALIVAVDTAAASLSAAGVAPDVLLVVDPQWWNTRHLDRLALDRTIVVSESSTHPRVFRLLKGELLFAASLFPLGRYLEQSTRISGTLGAGGSVATSAWDLARVLGCRPIYCAGLDLGFPAGHTHCHGSFFEERAHTLSQRTRPAEHQAFAYLYQADPYPVSDNSGAEVLTDKRMAIYHWWFANQAKIHRDSLNRNLSPHGVRIEGFTYTQTDDLLAQPDCRVRIDRQLESLRAEIRAAVSETERTADGGAAAEGPGQLYSRLQSLIGELQQIGSLCRTGRSAIAQSRNGALTAVEALAELDRIDTRLRTSQNRDIAGFMVQDVLTEVMHGDNGDTRTSADPLESSERIYAALQRSTDFHLAELQRALRSLGSGESA